MGFKNGVSMKRIILAMSMFVFSGNYLAAEPMNQYSMEKIVKEMAIESKGEKGVVEFNFNNIRMYLISDVKHNRMRILAPVEEYKNLSAEHRTAVLNSNFHLSLDARYAVSNDILYSVYVHPLAQLNDEQVRSAVKQVANLALSFGNQYTSGVLNYGGNKKSNSTNHKENQKNEKLDIELFPQI